MFVLLPLRMCLFVFADKTMLALLGCVFVCCACCVLCLLCVVLVVCCVCCELCLLFVGI